MAYKEINPGIFEFKEKGDSIEGVLLRKQEGLGSNNASMYTIENEEGMHNIWGSTILDQRMALANVGDKLMITFNGLGEAQPGKNPPKIFKVEVDKE